MSPRRESDNCRRRHEGPVLAASSAKDLARRRQPRVVRRRDGAPEVLEVPGRSHARAPGPVRGLDVDFYRGWGRGHLLLSGVRLRAYRTRRRASRECSAQCALMLAERVCRGFRPLMWFARPPTSARASSSAAPRACSRERAPLYILELGSCKALVFYHSTNPRRANPVNASARPK